MDSYTEFSQSGQGIHIIIRGKKPGSKCRKDNFEMYDSDRFFVMTGNQIKGTPDTIREGQRELSDLYKTMFGPVQTEVKQPNTLSDKEIIKLASSAKNGKKFMSLYRGDISAYGNDDSAADLALCSILAFWTRNPLQIDRIFRSSGLMRAKWQRLDYRERTITKALESTLKKLSPGRESQNNKTNLSIAQKTPEYELTDLGNSKRFITQCGHLCRYVYHFREWYVWNGLVWEKDQNGGIMRLAKNVVENMTAESRSGPQELVQHAKKSESFAAIKNMVQLAKSELYIDPSDLDRHHWLFNVTNGTIDLRTGQLMAAKQEHLMTQQATIEHREDAKAVRWMDFLQQIMNGNEELIKFIQRAAGYSLTGSVSEQVIFFLYGDGQNGKSTFLSILSAMMGSYARTLLARSLMVKKYDGINNDIAALKGARLVVTSEGEQDQYLAEALIKQLTGGDQRKARFLFGEYFEYEPTDKIWFMTNHKPVIKGRDAGIWRRILLIPFAVAIAAEDQDKQLKEKLMNELPGILNWAIEGCLEYQRHGLNPPQGILAASKAYMAEMDLVNQFVEETCEVEAGSKVRLKELYGRYIEWSKIRGTHILGCKKFQQELKVHGYNYRNSTGNQVYVFGLRLSDS